MRQTVHVGARCSPVVANGCPAPSVNGHLEVPTGGHESPHPGTGSAGCRASTSSGSGLLHAERLAFGDHGRNARLIFSVTLCLDARSAGIYSYQSWKLVPTDPFPYELGWLQQRAAALASLDPEEFAQILVSRYPPGATIGWHRDAPMFGAKVVGSPSPHPAGCASSAARGTHARSPRSP
jgi:hypothetical protein